MTDSDTELDANFASNSYFIPHPIYLNEKSTQIFSTAKPCHFFGAILRQTAEIQISPIEMGLIRIKTGAKFVATFKKMHRKTGFFLGAVSGPFFHTEICMNIPLGETGRVQFTQPIHSD